MWIGFTKSFNVATRQKSLYSLGIELHQSNRKKAVKLHRTFGIFLINQSVDFLLNSWRFVHMIVFFHGNGNGRMILHVVTMILHDGNERVQCHVIIYWFCRCRLFSPFILSILLNRCVPTHTYVIRWTKWRGKNHLKGSMKAVDQCIGHLQRKKNYQFCWNVVLVYVPCAND